MAIEARIRELGVRHQNLDRAIDEEMRRPSSDSLRLHKLKRQKLKLKEEIDSLRGHGPGSAAQTSSPPSA